MLRRNNKYYNDKLVNILFDILTLRGAEIGEVPDEFADKETVASQSIESLEMFGK